MIIPILPSQSSWRLHAIAIALKLADIDFELSGALQECQTFSIDAAARAISAETGRTQDSPRFTKRLPGSEVGVDLPQAALVFTPRAHPIEKFSSRQNTAPPIVVHVLSKGIEATTAIC